MAETREDYDPMVVVAANRSIVRLKNGMVGRLLYWSTTGDKATVYTGGRHVRVDKQDVVAVVGNL